MVNDKIKEDSLDALVTNVKEGICGLDIKDSILEIIDEYESMIEENSLMGLTLSKVSDASEEDFDPDYQFHLTLFIPWFGLKDGKNHIYKKNAGDEGVPIEAYFEKAIEECLEENPDTDIKTVLSNVDCNIFHILSNLLDKYNLTFDDIRPLSKD
jgi:hypothetical protein